MQKHVHILVLAAALAAATLLPGHAAAQLNDSGQTQCSDSVGAVVDCADDIGAQPGQDARFGRDAHAAAGSLTKVCGGAAGFDFCALEAGGAVVAQGDPSCIFDQRTGLIWSAETLTARAWADAAAAAAGYIHCGIDAGWRLPTRRELLSIVHHGASAPAIDSDAFVDTASAAYWSADAYALDPAQAWAVDFDDGDTLHAAQGESHLARLVVSSANQPPRITLGANIVVTREDRPVPLSFPGWATGISPGPPREAGQHLNATLRLLPVTDQKALEFDVPPSLDPETGTLSFTIKHTIYPDSNPNDPNPDPNDHSFDMWVSSAGLARVQVTLQDDGGIAHGGADTTVGEFTIFLDPVPAARDINIKHPWKASCIPVTHAAFDADSDPVTNNVWPLQPWWWPQVQIVSYPKQGFLTDYVSRGAGTVPAGDSDNFWLFMSPTTPELHANMYGEHYNYANTVCYVPMSSTFVGFDSYSYRVIDFDGNVSNTAAVTIEIFEVR